MTADAAYDTVGFYEAAGARGATVVVSPTSTANVSRHGPRSSARDRTILAVKEIGRRRWTKTSGYHGQARVENAFFRYKSIIGDGLRRPGDDTFQFQGEVLRESNGMLFVRLYDTMGDPSTQQFLSDEQVASARFYDTAEEWRGEGERLNRQAARHH